MAGTHPIVEVVVPDALAFDWVTHDQAVDVGPFHFPAAVPVPVAAEGNAPARYGWLNVPFAGRPPVTGELEDEGSPAHVSGRELLRAYLDGHLSERAPDFHDLVDEIGRCLVIHASFGAGEPWFEEARDVFSRVPDGESLFDVLVNRAKLRVAEGRHYVGDGDEALTEYVIARLLYQGAHLLSPATPGVLLEMGALTHDMAHTLAVEGDVGDDEWRLPLAREAAHLLKLALADRDVREQTPALFLLAINRETLGDRDDAKEAYARFLASPAADRFPDVAKAARRRSDRLHPGNG